jgi:hypothetical protein
MEFLKRMRARRQRRLQVCGRFKAVSKLTAANISKSSEQPYRPRVFCLSRRNSTSTNTFQAAIRTERWWVTLFKLRRSVGIAIFTSALQSPRTGRFSTHISRDRRRRRIRSSSDRRLDYADQRCCLFGGSGFSSNRGSSRHRAVNVSSRIGKSDCTCRATEISGWSASRSTHRVSARLTVGTLRVSFTNRIFGDCQQCWYECPSESQRQGGPPPPSGVQGANTGFSFSGYIRHEMY